MNMRHLCNKYLLTLNCFPVSHSYGIVGTPLLSTTFVRHLFFTKSVCFECSVSQMLARPYSFGWGFPAKSPCADITIQASVPAAPPVFLRSTHPVWLNFSHCPPSFSCIPPKTSSTRRQILTHVNWPGRCSAAWKGWPPCRLVLSPFPLDGNSTRKKPYNSECDRVLYISHLALA